MDDILKPPLGVGWDRARGWRDQHDRMLRWHARLMHDIEMEAAEGAWSIWPDELWDTAMAFFQSAYHLKDWILHDHPESRRDLEWHFSENQRLAICADICNGTKHREVGRNHRTSAHIVGVREFAPNVPSQSRWLVMGPDGPISLEVLARDVVAAWEGVLRRLDFVQKQQDQQ